ncbi:hypothetical protein [Anaerophilus nitritogenes]|uniref:hypothetical protein n=1 Tax=Anaerophilus nitritogenes TaxID=2498136 RepID=UPI00101D8A10|nr:hypothetical protein [Anaerophilus nitritogenes]
MFFEDYTNTKVLYHIISLIDLKRVLQRGIHFDDKITYQTKYDGFHEIIDNEKPEYIPKWVIRNKSIFASMNYSKNHYFHSHSAVLSIQVNPKKCWVANENYANEFYEPFVLQHIKDFEGCKKYIQNEGKKLLKKYWETSLSFEENLKARKDKTKGYDAEVLILHSIEPKDIEIEYIVSDHKMMTIKEWKNTFCG